MQNDRAHNKVEQD